MSNQPRLEDFYIALLESAGLTVLDDGKVVLVDGEGAFPVSVSGRQLVVPTREVLKSPPEFWDEHIDFHPLSESVIRGTSPVLKHLVKVMDLRLTEVIHHLMKQLALIAADKNKHASLKKPEQHVLLDSLKVADEKTINFLDKVLDAGHKNAQHRLLSTNIKTGGMYQGKKWQRLCARVFPIFSYVNDKKSSVFNVSGRKADVAGIPALFKFILPGSDDHKKTETYNFGSNASTAPSLRALLEGYILVAKRLNEVVDIFEEHLENADQLTIDLNWQDSLEDLNTMKSQIPDLEGSKGTVQANTPAPATPATGSQQPAQTQENGNVVNADGTVEWRSPTQAQQPVQQNTFQQQPAQTNPGQPLRPVYNPFAESSAPGMNNPFQQPNQMHCNNMGGPNPFAHNNMNMPMNNGMNMGGHMNMNPNMNNFHAGNPFAHNNMNMGMNPNVGMNMGNGMSMNNMNPNMNMPMNNGMFMGGHMAHNNMGHGSMNPMQSNQPLYPAEEEA